MVGINKPLPCKVFLVDSPPQEGRFTVYDWYIALALARAGRDRVRVYLPLFVRILKPVGDGTIIV